MSVVRRLSLVPCCGGALSLAGMRIIICWASPLDVWYNFWKESVLVFVARRRKLVGAISCRLVAQLPFPFPLYMYIALSFVVFVFIRCQDITASPNAPSKVWGRAALIVVARCVWCLACEYQWCSFSMCLLDFPFFVLCLVFLFLRWGHRLYRESVWDQFLYEKSDLCMVFPQPRAYPKGSPSPLVTFSHP
jgi:hypothetical protein